MNNLSSLPITVFLYPLIIIYNLHLFLFSDQISAATSTTDDDNQFYRNCGNTFNCGSSITGIRYPFRGSNDPSYCGYPGLVLDCDGSTNSTTINIVNQKYVVLQISQSAQTMKIVRGDVMKDICPSDQLANATLDFSLFEYTGNYINLTFLYGCAFPINLPAASQILVSCVDVYAIYGPLSFGICRTSVVYPVLESSFLSGGSVNATVTGQILQEGFEIRWKVDSSACIECVSSKGRCGYDFGTSQTTCFCPDLTYLTTKGTCSLVDVGNGIAGISPGSAPSVR